MQLGSKLAWLIAAAACLLLRWHSIRIPGILHNPGAHDHRRFRALWNLVRITSNPECTPWRALDRIGAVRSARCEVPPKSSSGKLPARGSRFRSYDEQTSKPQGIPPHRQRHLSRFGNVHHPCTRASPQCHELPLQPTHAVVLKFLHELYVLVAAGTDSRVHLLRIFAQHRAHGGADRPRRVNLK